MINFNECLEHHNPRPHYSRPTSLLDKHRGTCDKLCFVLQSKSQFKPISLYVSLVKTSSVVSRKMHTFRNKLLKAN